MTDQAARERPDTAPTGRSLAPDIARGWMLLFIALANVPWFLYNRAPSLPVPREANPVGIDLVWQFIAVMTIDFRSYPLFGLLFGYGMWQLFARQQASGRDERRARRLLQARHSWMLIFGAVHAALLWQGEIVGAYGLAGLLVVWLFLRRTDRTLRIWVYCLFGVLATVTLMSVVPAFFISSIPIPPITLNAAMSDPSYFSSIGLRLSSWVAGPLFQAMFMLQMVFIGILAARHRVLDDPLKHRRMLARTAVIAIPIGWLGGIPFALSITGLWNLSAFFFLFLHMLTGMICALGYIALFALLAARAAQSDGPGVVGGSLAAVGKRSLSSYVFQSVVFAPLFCAWGFGLGAFVTGVQAALIAVATWLVSLVIAVVLERAGKRGPLEWLLRKLAYRSAFHVATPVTGASTPSADRAA